MAATLWIYVDMVLIVWLTFKPSIRMCKKVNLSDFVWLLVPNELV